MKRLEVDDAALDANHRRMRPVVGAQLREDVLDAALDRVFRD